MADKIQYQVIPKTKTQEIHDFLVKNFFPNEPISRAFGLPINQVTRWFMKQVEECLKPEISIAAYDSTTGELVGVAINIIVEKTLKSGKEGEGRGLLDLLDPEKEPIMIELAKVLGVLNQIPNEVYKNVPNPKDTFKTFNCVYLAVLPSYAGQRIGYRLVEESEKLAKKLPVSFLQVDTTSQFSFKIFQKCGYEVVREIDMEGLVPRIETVDGGAHKKGRILLKKL